MPRDYPLWMETLPSGIFKKLTAPYKTGGHMKSADARIHAACTLCAAYDTLHDHGLDDDAAYLRPVIDRLTTGAREHMIRKYEGMGDDDTVCKCGARYRSMYSYAQHLWDETR